MQEQPTIPISRRQLIIGAVVVIVILLVWWLFTHTIISASADNSEITVTNSDGIVVVNGDNSVWTIIPTGTYSVTATTTNGASRQQVEALAFRIADVSLTVNDAGNSRVLTNGPVSSIHKLSNSYLYIDRTDAVLYKSTGATRTPLDDRYKFYAMAWEGSTGFAYATENDKPIVLVLQNDKVVRKTDLGSGNMSFVADSANDSWYVAVGRTLYRTDNNGKTYKQLNKYNNAITVLSAQGGTVAISIATGQFDRTVSIIDSITNKERKSFTVQVSESPDSGVDVSFSPSGEYMSFILNGYVTFYDKDFNEVSLPILNTLREVHWVSSDTFDYAESNKIWRYHINSGLSEARAQLATYNTVASFYPDNNTYIMTVENSGGLLYYESSSSPGSNESAILAESNIIETTPYCNLYFTNMTKPAIWVKTSDDAFFDCRISVVDYISAIQLEDARIPTSYSTY